VTLLSRNGHHFTGRYPDIAFLLRALPAKAAIIDAELVACSSTGVPDFASSTPLPRRQMSWIYGRSTCST